MNHYLAFYGNYEVKYFLGCWKSTKKKAGVTSAIKRFPNAKAVKSYIDSKNLTLLNKGTLTKAMKNKSVNKYATMDESRKFRGVPKGFQNEVRDFKGDFTKVPKLTLKQLQRSGWYWLERYTTKGVAVCRCKVCGDLHRFEKNIKKHKCLGHRSEYENRTHKALRKLGFKFKVEYDTLRVLAPDTQMIMPYDIELREHKVLIEVQGEQHLEYVPSMHKNKSEFKRRKYLDDIKYEYATSKGYIVLYLYPE